MPVSKPAKKTTSTKKAPTLKSPKKSPKLQKPKSKSASVAPTKSKTTVKASAKPSKLVKVTAKNGAKTTVSTKVFAKTPAKTPAKVVKAVSKVPAKIVKKVKKSTKAVAPLNQTQLIESYLERLDGWSRAEVVLFLKTQNELMAEQLGPKGPGVHLFPGMLKVVATKKPPVKMPAIKKGTMVKGFGGVEQVSPGRAAFTKPASAKFKCRAMAKLKAAVLA